MRILLVAATQMEIGPYLNDYNPPDVLITGLGVPSALYHLQKRLFQSSYDLVIQAGIAGSFKDEIKPGKVVAIRQDTFGDIGMEKNRHFTSIFETTFYNKNEFPFKYGWLINPNNLLDSLSLPLVNAITINKISDSLLQKQQLIDSFSPQVESMEGAALHYFCLQENISFLQIRGISNYVGEREKTKWKMADAINNLSDELSQLINGLTS